MIIYRPNGEVLSDITPEDSSYRYRAIMGENSLTLYFSLPEHLEIPVGAYCNFQGERYTLERPEALTMRHSRDFEYTVVFEGAQFKSKKWIFKNSVDGRVRFSLTATPEEHLQMFVDNMNSRDSGWTLGDCVEHAEITINYDHDFCWDALCKMADALSTECSIENKTVSLGKVEHNKDNPLSLSYGCGNGFKAGVGRSNYGDMPPIETLYVQGGDRNIDPSVYGSSELHLPKSKTIRFDGDKFEDETDFVTSKAQTYVTDSDGLSVTRQGGQSVTQAEDSLDCSDIYPSRVGQVSSVVVVDASKNFYDIIDSSIPNTLNYEDCLIKGETMTIIFQSGMLAGREFEVKYFNQAQGSKQGKRFEIVPQEIDGQVMPNSTFAPAVDDSYAVFHCMLPQAYINSYVSSGDAKSGAEWDMMRQAVRYLYDHESETFSFSGTLDGIWAKQNWATIGAKIILGGFISFTDSRFQTTSVLVRIISIKDYVTNPNSPEIELSNSTVTGSFSTTLKKLESTEVSIERAHQEATLFTKRRFRDAKETMEMLEASLIGNFSESISPIAVQTMMMLVGDESLQFHFIDTSHTPPTVITPNIVYNATTKKLSCPQSVIEHLTLGITSLSSQHSSSDYKRWSMSAFTSAALNDPDKRYYLYAVCNQTTGTSTGTGTFTLSETSKPLSENNKYNLLVGILNKEIEGTRSYVSLYGFTEVLPGRVTTDRVISGNGQSYFDLVSNALKLSDRLSFNVNGDGKLVINGVIVQNSGGYESTIGLFRGAFNNALYYYNGDEVTYTSDGNTSTYRCISQTSIRGIVPTNTAYWTVTAKGETGAQGSSLTTVDNYYIAWANGITAPSKSLTSWQKNTIPQLSTAKPYLWNYEVVKNDLGTVVSETNAACIGNLSSDGVGIEQVQECYYATRTSATPTTLPIISTDKKSVNLNGWETASPATSSTYRYIWNIELFYYTDGTISMSPPHMTGVQGERGAQGYSPAMVFRGTYDPTATYYGNTLRLDVVKYNSSYYITKIDAGTFSNVNPLVTSKWNAFGASFESVATQLLLAENANIAGWIFRDGRLESQAQNSDGEPMAFLNGVSGDMRMKGTMQLSTGISGNYDDVNLFYLPSSDVDAYITLGWELEDIGKVVRLFNSGGFNKHKYTIAAHRFTVINGQTSIHELEFQYEVKPQEIVEMTCMEYMQGSSSVKYAKWVLTSRFATTDFRQNSTEGRFPLILALGRLWGENTSSVHLDGYWFDGRPLTNLFSVTRNSQGKYTLSSKSGVNILPSDYHVFLTGLNGNWKGAALSKSMTGFRVYVSDDDSTNDGNVEIMILANDWWYNMT